MGVDWLLLGDSLCSFLCNGEGEALAGEGNGLLSFLPSFLQAHGCLPRGMVTAAAPAPEAFLAPS